MRSSCEASAMNRRRRSSLASRSPNARSRRSSIALSDDAQPADLGARVGRLDAVREVAAGDRRRPCARCGRAAAARRARATPPARPARRAPPPITASSTSESRWRVESTSRAGPPRPAWSPPAPARRPAPARGAGRRSRRTGCGRRPGAPAESAVERPSGTSVGQLQRRAGVADLGALEHPPVGGAQLGGRVVRQAARDPAAAAEEVVRRVSCPSAGPARARSGPGRPGRPGRSGASG